MSDLEKALAKAVMSSILEEQEEEAAMRPPEIEARRMIDFHLEMNNPARFSPGDLVVWKRGLKNGKFPLNNTPAIVSQVYDKPIMRTDMDSGSNHFREPLDLVILVDTGDEVSEFHVDGRRFKPYEGAVEGK